MFLFHRFRSKNANSLSWLNHVATRFWFSSFSFPPPAPNLFGHASLLFPLNEFQKGGRTVEHDALDDMVWRLIRGAMFGRRQKSKRRKTKKHIKALKHTVISWHLRKWTQTARQSVRKRWCEFKGLHGSACQSREDKISNSLISFFCLTSQICSSNSLAVRGQTSEWFPLGLVVGLVALSLPKDDFLLKHGHTHVLRKKEG